MGVMKIAPLTIFLKNSATDTIRCLSIRTPGTWLELGRAEPRPSQMFLGPLKAHGLSRGDMDPFFLYPRPFRAG